MDSMRKWLDDQRLARSIKRRRKAHDELLARLRAWQREAEPTDRQSYTLTIQLLEGADTASVPLLDALAEHHQASSECMGIVWLDIDTTLKALGTRLKAAESAISRARGEAETQAAESELHGVLAALGVIDARLFTYGQAESADTARERAASDLFNELYDKITHTTESSFMKDLLHEGAGAAMGAAGPVGTAADVMLRVLRLRKRAQQGFEAKKKHTRYVVQLGNAAASWTIKAASMTERLQKATFGPDC
jgi:hypothetical protein